MGYRMADSVKKWLTNQGYTVGGFLGEGAFGAVYDLGKGLVIKATTQKEDFVNLSKLATLRLNGISPPCLPRPQRIIRFEHDGNNQSYGLIREDYKDADWPEDLSYKLQTLVRDGGRGNLEKLYPQYNAEILESHPQHYGKWLAMVETADFCIQYGFAFGDAHRANWGTDAAGIPVFRDIGHCSFKHNVYRTYEFVDRKMTTVEIREDKEAA